MRQGGDPKLRVRCEHLPPSVAALVKDWFAGRIETYRKSGDRSVYIPHAEDGHTHIKIKGAGMRGGAIEFGRYLNAGPDAPLFDYDGRRMLDVAMSHDGAFVGGASMQQAVTEWQITRALTDLGYETVTCLGYGTVSDGEYVSWFSVYRWHEDWNDSVRPPQGDIETYETLARHVSKVALDLATQHDLVGFFWCIRSHDRGVLLKDLHPFRRLDPINHSQISWVMQVCYSLHITAINTRQLATLWFGEGVRDRAGLWMFRPFLPDITDEDWDDLRFRVVMPYMARDHEAFRPEELVALLEANPISAKLMALCPPKFARFS